MAERGTIGTWRTRKQANRKPITAVDGVLGVVMMYSYFAGGKNLFPDDVDPQMYIDGIEYVPGYGRAVFMDDDGLSAAIESVAVSVERHIKTVTAGSLKNYLSHIRNGKYPNGGGVCPPFNTAYKRDGSLIIYPRDYEADVNTGDWEELPAWLREMTAQREDV